MKNKFDDILDLSNLPISAIQFNSSQIGKTYLLKGTINNVLYDEINDIIHIDVNGINLTFYPESDNDLLDLEKRCFEEAVFMITLDSIEDNIIFATCSAIVFDKNIKILVN